MLRTLALLSALTTSPIAFAAAQVAEPPRLLDDIKFLTDDRLQGRATGSPGSDGQERDWDPAGS
jgi:hypothetical protein